MEQQRIVHDVTQSSSSRQVNRSLHTTIETTIIQDTTTTQITTTAVSNHTTINVVHKETSNTIKSHPTSWTTILRQTIFWGLVRSVRQTIVHPAQPPLAQIVHHPALSPHLCAPCTHAVVAPSTHHLVLITTVKHVTYNYFTTIPRNPVPTDSTP